MTIGLTSSCGQNANIFQENPRYMYIHYTHVRSLLVTSKMQMLSTKSYRNPRDEIKWNGNSQNEIFKHFGIPCKVVQCHSMHCVIPCTMNVIFFISQLLIYRELSFALIYWSTMTAKVLKSKPEFLFEWTCLNNQAQHTACLFPNNEHDLPFE